MARSVSATGRAASDLAPLTARGSQQAARAGGESSADVVTAADDFERCGGEWPAGQRRAWEPLSQVRERAAAALTRHLSPVNDDQVLIAVCHQMVIRALTGERSTATGAFRRISFPGRRGQ